MKQPPITEDEFRRFICNECSVEEARKVIDFLSQNEASQKVWIEKQLSQPIEDNKKDNEKAISEGWQNIQAQLHKKSESKIKRIAPYWVAAACLGMLVISPYLFKNKESAIEKSIVQKPAKSDVAPGGNKATLTLSNGSVILLDSTASGHIAKQGNTIIKLGNGQLSYTASNQKPGEVLFNTLATPMGGQYNIILPDGSRVWLNAESSLRFPAAFVEERIVELTGEAYFEVAKNASMPFHVKVSNADVQVLGTHFNINAYTDEAVTNTTLLEGRIKISTGSSANVLTPGQQASINNTGGIKVISNADTEQVVAWKNGNFQFNMSDIQSIMRQLQRWYNIEVAYAGKIPAGHYMGGISRSNNLSVVLQMFEQSGLRFSLVGKKLTVLE